MLSCARGSPDHRRPWERFIDSSAWKPRTSPQQSRCYHPRTPWQSAPSSGGVSGLSRSPQLRIPPQARAVVGRHLGLRGCRSEVLTFRLAGGCGLFSARTRPGAASSHPSSVFKDSRRLCIRLAGWREEVLAQGTIVKGSHHILLADKGTPSRG